MPDSTSALINQLTNPPNPFEKFGATVDFANKLKDFQAQKAIADIYQQSIDPTTGLVDPNKFGSLAQSNPAALWKYGLSQKQMGEGMQAQGYGSSAQTQAAQDQLGAQAAYMEPLIAKAQNGTVTADDVRNVLHNMPPGLVSPTMINNFEQQVTNGADPNNWVKGAFFANGHAREILNQAQGPVATINQGPYSVPTRVAPPFARGGVAPPVPMGVSPDTEGQIVTVHRSDGVDEQMPYKRAITVIGGQVPGADRGVTYTGYDPPPAPPSAGTGGAGAETGGGPGPTPLGRIRPLPAGGGGAAGATGSAGAGAGATGATGAAPSDTGGATGATGAAGGQGFTYGQTPPPGQVATTEDSAAAFRADRANQEQSQTRLYNIQQARQALSGAKTGTRTELAQSVNGIIGTWAPQFVQTALQGTGYDPKKLATNRDEAEKYLQAMANANGSAIGGPTTNDKLAAATKASPNVHIQDLAADQVLDALAAQERMQQAMFQEGQGAGVTPQNWANWKTKWIANNDPRAWLPMTASRKKYLMEHIKPGSKEEQIFMNSSAKANAEAPSAPASGQAPQE